jgi:hypothetical protein
MVGPTHSFPFPDHYYSPEKNPITTATGCRMPSVHHCRHRYSRSHAIDTGAFTVMLPLRLPGSVLIVVLFVIDHWHRSSFISPFSSLVVVLSAGALDSASHHVPFVQLILMLSAGASSSASCHTSTSHDIPLMPPCMVATYAAAPTMGAKTTS